MDISQITDLGVRVGRELDDDELAVLETESQFGKLYSRALEYCLMRPHSVREVRDYLYRKTLRTKYKTRQGEVREKEGYSPTLATRVLEKLQQKRYVDDEQFARWWVETRNRTKGTSLRKLSNELRAKGVEMQIVEEVLAASDRADTDELQKLIAKKRTRYPDDTKLIQYLARQGFRYDDIAQALRGSDEFTA
ncbi:MAG TPA: regulatory protein RecX [Candidatus Saccharimonas sp.]|nr:regulatory protein RecX [Candidatus Saccharimonas sp.]